jgi:hypothetical protein
MPPEAIVIAIALAGAVLIVAIIGLTIRTCQTAATRRRELLHEERRLQIETGQRFHEPRLTAFRSLRSIGTVTAICFPAAAVISTGLVLWLVDSMAYRVALISVIWGTSMFVAMAVLAIVAGGLTPPAPRPRKRKNRPHKSKHPNDPLKS